jgi:hypothetical protein
MNVISVCGIIFLIIGLIALIACSSEKLNGDPEYTYRAGVILTFSGLILTVICGGRI